MKQRRKWTPEGLQRDMLEAGFSREVVLEWAGGLPEDTPTEQGSLWQSDDDTL